MKKIIKGKRNIPKILAVAIVCLIGISAIAFSSSSAFANILMGGNASETVASDYIGEAAVREIVLAKAPGATITALELENENGVVFYKGEMYLDKVEYDFSVDATTGAILEWKIDEKACIDDPCDEQDCEDIALDDSAYIGIAAAKEIALAKVPGAVIREIELENDEGRVEYDGEMYLGNTVYDFTIDAITGDILEWESEICNDVAEDRSDAASDAADQAQDEAEEATDN